MTFVVTEQCIRCKYTDCVDVCPVDCFHEGPNFLVINPDGCIDCALCIPECPVEAIYDENELPEEFSEYIQLNASLSAEWPEILTSKEPLEEADTWADQLDKRASLLLKAESI